MSITQNLWQERRLVELLVCTDEHGAECRHLHNITYQPKRCEQKILHLIKRIVCMVLEPLELKVGISSHLSAATNRVSAALIGVDQPCSRH